MRDNECCYNCNNYQRGRCDVIDDVMLIMARVVDTNCKCKEPFEYEISKTAVIKDDYNLKFKCNFYKKIGGEKE